MKKIKLTQVEDKYAIVDNEDYDRLAKWKWGYSKGYAARRQHLRVENGKQISRFLSMHRDIMDHQGINVAGKDVDHKNRNTLDNRKVNLRIATRSQNNANAIAPRNNTSGYRGVSWHKHNKKWYARFNFQGKTIRIGFFTDKMEAVKAYNKTTIHYLGEFARPNVIKNDLR